MYPQQTPNLCFPFPDIVGVHYGHRHPLAWIKLEKIYLRQYRTEASFLHMFSIPTRTQWRLQRNTLLSHVPKIGNGSESRLPEKQESCSYLLMYRQLTDCTVWEDYTTTVADEITT